MATSTLGSGTLVLAGTTSGTTTVTATAVAGTTTLTLPAATDTLVGKATTDTLTNKTLTSPTLTGVVTFDAGTAAAPAITTTGDTNTGIFFPAADTIAFAEGGVESMRIDANGTVGVGVTPAAWSLSGLAAVQIKDVSLAGFSNAMYLNNNVYYNGGWKFIGTGYGLQYTADRGAGAYSWNISTASGTAGNAITFTQAMTLDASGRLLLNTTSTIASAGRLQVVAGSGQDPLYIQSTAIDGYSGINFYNNSSTNVFSVGYANASAGVAASTGYIYTGGATPITFWTNGTERARIDTSGNLLVGTTSRQNATTFAVLSAGNVGEFRTSGGSCDVLSFYTSGSTLAGRINSNGSATTYVTSSDYRLKENIVPMTNALAVVEQLKPCTYSWKESGVTSQGFIAHELQEVVPDAVVGEKDAVNEDGSIKPQGIDTSFLVATLTAAIQELNAKFEEYKAAHP